MKSKTRCIRSNCTLVLVNFSALLEIRNQTSLADQEPGPISHSSELAYFDSYNGHSQTGLFLCRDALKPGILVSCRDTLKPGPARAEHG